MTLVTFISLPRQELATGQFLNRPASLLLARSAAKFLALKTMVTAMLYSR